ARERRSRWRRDLAVASSGLNCLRTTPATSANGSRRFAWSRRASSEMDSIEVPPRSQALLGNEEGNVIYTRFAARRSNAPVALAFIRRGGCDDAPPLRWMCPSRHLRQRSFP